jgi:hypothetical protein
MTDQNASAPRDADWADARRDDCLALQRRAHALIAAGEKDKAWPLLQDAVAGRRDILAWGKPGDLSFELASACVQAIFAAPDDAAANDMYKLAAETLNPLVASGVEHPRLTQLLDALARIGGVGNTNT